MRLEEKLMILAGALLLASLPYLSGGDFYVWLAAKVTYAVGLIFMWMRKSINE